LAVQNASAHAAEHLAQSALGLRYDDLPLTAVEAAKQQRAILTAEELDDVSVACRLLTVARELET
jgi:hypothetical protein